MRSKPFHAKLQDLCSRFPNCPGTQAQGSEAVSKNVAGISAYTQQTAAGAQQAQESIGRLADLAGELNSSLKRFKLPKVAA